MEMFQFNGFSPSPQIRVKANRLLARLQEEAPGDAKTTAQLTWDGEHYTCSIKIDSKLYPLNVNASHWNVGIAIDKAELTIARRLERLHGVRFPLSATAAFRPFQRASGG